MKIEVASPPTEADVLAYFEALSNWGRWGPDDELGTANFVSAEKRRQAFASVREGRTISCSRTIRPYERGTALPTQHFMTMSGEGAPAEGMGVAADWIGIAPHGHTVTHLDSHSHLFWDGRMYNGRSADSVTTSRGATAGSIENLREGLVSRGVLLDVPRLLGRDHLRAGEAIHVEHLEACERSQGVAVERGDVLVVHLGRDALARASGHDDPEGEGTAGLHAACLPWLHAREVAALCSDAVHDVMPSGYPRIPQPVHAVGIVAMGLWLLDNADTEALADACAAASRWEFLFVAAPLRLKNTTGSPVNPLAIM